MKIGVHFGRFQPFHDGHRNNIKQIISKGYNPLILIGSAQEFRTAINPYTYYERKQMILAEFPSVQVEPLPDFEHNDDWLTYFRNILSLTKGTLFIHNKESERGKYGLKSHLFITDYLTGGELKVSYPYEYLETITQVNATDIRKDIKNSPYIPEKTKYWLKSNNLLDFVHVIGNDRNSREEYLGFYPKKELSTWFNHKIYGGVDYYIKG